MLKRLFSSRLRINMASGVIANCVNFLILAVTVPVCLHYLGVELYGLWLALSVVMQFAQMGDLGVRSAVMKIVAEEYGKGNSAAIEGYLTASLLFVSFVGGLVLLLLLSLDNTILGLFRFESKYFELAVRLLPLVGGLSVYMLQVQIVNAALSGMGRMDLANLLQTIGRLASLVVTLFALWNDCGVFSFVFGAVAVCLTIHFGSWFFLRRLFSIKIFNYREFQMCRVRRLLGYGSGVFGGSVILMLIVPTTKMFLARYVGLESVTVYDVAFRGAQQFRGFVGAAFQALVPEISKLSANETLNSQTRIRELNRRSTRIVLVYGLPVAFCIALSSNLLLELWLGADLPQNLPHLFRLLFVSAFTTLVAASAYSTLLALGAVRHTFYGHLLFLSAYFGIIGSCMLINKEIDINYIGWASVLASISSAVYILLQYDRQMKMRDFLMQEYADS